MITKEQREQLTFLGIKIPKSTFASGEAEVYLEFDDLREDWEVNCKCPHCNKVILVNQDTPDRGIECKSCGAVLDADFDIDTEVSVRVNLHPRLSPADQKYLDLKNN